MVDLTACITCTHEHVLDSFPQSRNRSARYVSHFWQSHEIEPLNFGKCLRWWFSTVPLFVYRMTVAPWHQTWVVIISIPTWRLGSSVRGRCHLIPAHNLLVPSTTSTTSLVRCRLWCCCLCSILCMRLQPCVQVTSVQLMRLGIGQSASCTVDKSSRPAFFQKDMW